MDQQGGKRLAVFNSNTMKYKAEKHGNKFPNVSCIHYPADDSNCPSDVETFSKNHLVFGKMNLIKKKSKLTQNTMIK